MIIATTLITIVLIICISILIGLYMDYCKESGIKMFAKPRYEERIKELEKQVKQMEDKE